MNFTQSQLEVINFNKGRLKVIASAGSGKSTTLVYRVENLIKNHKVRPSDICLISFTKESANDLKSKLKKIGVAGVHVSTIHSLAYKILKDNDYSVANDIPIYEFEKQFQKIAGDQQIDMGDIMLYIGYQKANLVKPSDDPVGEDRFDKVELYHSLYKKYQSILKRNNCRDFGDYLIDCYELLENNEYADFTPFSYVMMDEFQDSNKAQQMLLEKLCDTDNIVVVGDVKQNIYNFQASSVEGFYDFKADKVVHLDENFRSLSPIVENSNDFIRPFFKEYEDYSDSIGTRKEIASINCINYDTISTESNEVVTKIKELVSQGVSKNDIAVLYRNNNMSGNIEAELKKNNIDYTISKASSFFEQPELKALICCLRLLKDEKDEVAFETLIRLRLGQFKFVSNVLLQKIKDHSYRYGGSILSSAIKLAPANLKTLFSTLNKTISTCSLENNLNRIIDRFIVALKLRDAINEKYANEEERAYKLENLKTFSKISSNFKKENLGSFINYCLEPPKKKRTKKLKGFTKDEGIIELSTIHNSKGKEWKYVFIVGMNDKFPSQNALANPKFYAEEANLFYVGITRAKDSLTIIGDKNNAFFKSYDKINKMRSF